MNFLRDHYKPKLECIGRVRTSQYEIKGGFAYTKTFKVLKRRSQLNIDDFCSDIIEYLPLNFLEVEDGVYKLGVINESRDWETGMVDDWDVTLIKVEE